MPVIDAIFFDVGGTILDESREFETWADWLGVPRHTFSAVFGAVIARGLGYQETFRVFRPDFDLAAERERRAAAGMAESFGEADLYPDARSCLTALKDQGLFLGLAGNQPAHAEPILRALDLGVDVIGTSAGWAWRSRHRPSSRGSFAKAVAPRRRSSTSATGPTTTSARPWRPKCGRV